MKIRFIFKKIKNFCLLVFFLGLLVHIVQTEVIGGGGGLTAIYDNLLVDRQVIPAEHHQEAYFAYLHDPYLYPKATKKISESQYSMFVGASCIATFLTTEILITVSHCLGEKTLELQTVSHLKILTFDTSVGSVTPQISSASRFVTHPVYDVALIVLDKHHDHQTHSTGASFTNTHPAGLSDYSLELFPDELLKLDRIYMLGRDTPSQHQKTLEDLSMTAKIFQTTTNSSIRSLKLCLANMQKVGRRCMYSLSRKIYPGDSGSPVIGEDEHQGETRQVLLGVLTSGSSHTGWYVSIKDVEPWLKEELMKIQQSMI